MLSFSFLRKLLKRMEQRVKDIKDENYCQDLLYSKKKDIINDSKVKLTLVAERNLTMNHKTNLSCL